MPRADTTPSRRARREALQSRMTQSARTASSVRTAASVRASALAAAAAGSSPSSISAPIIKREPVVTPIPGPSPKNSSKSHGSPTSWRHPSELQYIRSSGRAWDDMAIVRFLVANAFSVPPRSTSTTEAWFQVQCADGRSVPLPRGYRLPLLWVAKYQWTSVKLVLTAHAAIRQREWDSAKFEILHIARLCAGLLAAARAQMDEGGAMERGWRCPMFDRALRRYWHHWLIMRDEFVRDFWREFGEEEFQEDVLKLTWSRWALKGHKGFVVSNEEVADGVTAGAFMRGFVVDEDAGTFEWNEALEETPHKIEKSIRAPAPAPAPPIPVPIVPPISAATPAPSGVVSFLVRPHVFRPPTPASEVPSTIHQASGKTPVIAQLSSPIADASMTVAVDAAAQPTEQQSVSNSSNATDMSTTTTPDPIMETNKMEPITIRIPLPGEGRRSLVSASVSTPASVSRTTSPVERKASRRPSTSAVTDAAMAVDLPLVRKTSGTAYPSPPGDAGESEIVNDDGETEVVVARTKIGSLVPGCAVFRSPVPVPVPMGGTDEQQQGGEEGSGDEENESDGIDNEDEDGDDSIPDVKVEIHEQGIGGTQNDTGTVYSLLESDDMELGDDLQLVYPDQPEERLSRPPSRDTESRSPHDTNSHSNSPSSSPSVSVAGSRSVSPSSPVPPLSSAQFPPVSSSDIPTSTALVHKRQTTAFNEQEQLGMGAGMTHFLQSLGEEVRALRAEVGQLRGNLEISAPLRQLEGRVLRLEEREGKTSSSRTLQSNGAERGSGNALWAHPLQHLISASSDASVEMEVDSVSVPRLGDTTPTRSKYGSAEGAVQPLPPRSRKFNSVGRVQ
ncbi:hypothetical protein B0H11DRAFT_2282661 [Mycena galericulata]|nr:hypothetical protein B0H11DRAFT_2282661 [Mycena galericulata]